MKITETNENGKIVIKPEGWLDTASSPELGEAIDKIGEADEFILDVGEVEYMASAGLRQVVAAHKRASEIGASLAVVNVGSEVMSIFRITGIDKKLAVKPKEQA